MITLMDETSILVFYVFNATYPEYMLSLILFSTSLHPKVDLIRHSFRIHVCEGI